MRNMKGAMGMRVILFIVMFHIAIFFSLPPGTAYDFGVLDSFVELNEADETLASDEDIANTFNPDTKSDLMGGATTIFTSAITLAKDGISLLFGLATAPLALFGLSGIPFVIKVIIGVPLSVMYLLAIFAWWKGNEI